MLELEEHYDSTLLLHHRDATSPTETGLELLRHAEEIFSVLERAHARIADLENELTGRFVLGCHESLGSYFLPAPLPAGDAARRARHHADPAQRELDDRIASA